MKTLKAFTTSLLLLITISLTAQQGINYKAHIKDGGGNVVADQSIAVQFIIYEGSALINNVYQETQTPTTDANGFVIVNIGEGSVDSGVYADIDWGADDHYLNVHINTGSGFVDMGTTQFMAVPYALNAANVTGLEQITEGANTGWRLVGSNPAYYGNIGNNSTDLSFSNNSVEPSGATGNFSTAMGYFTAASGYYSTAMGYYTTALGSRSTAMGRNTTAQSHASTVMGRYNIIEGDIDFWEPTDPLFVIGNGTFSVPSNALTVLKNGNTDISGVLRASGNVWPTTGHGVEIAYNSSLGIGYVQAYDRDSALWKDLAFGAINVRPVTDNFTSLGASNKRWLAVYAVNGTIQTSDRRMKKEINTINYGLNTVMQLRPVSYRWKKGNQNLNLGLIAQEVQKIIPEVVDVGSNKDKTLGMNYSELIPVLTKAIQEQQEIIDEQNNKLTSQESKINTQDKNYEKLLKRVEQLELASNK